MKNPITAQRLSYALCNANMRPQDLANASGVGKASISQYLSGSHAPSNISSGKMAQVLKVSPVWLMGFDVPMIEDSSCKSSAIKINVYGRVAAGIPLEMIEDIIDTEGIPEEMARTGEFFGLQIHGDSMEPKFSNGDTVIVRKQEDAESDEIVIATVNGTDPPANGSRNTRTALLWSPPIRPTTLCTSPTKKSWRSLCGFWERSWS